MYTKCGVNTVGLNRASDVLDKEGVISPLQLEEGRNPPFEETASGDSSLATLPGSFFGITPKLTSRNYLYRGQTLQHLP
jgi:hypothetical protein